MTGPSRHVLDLVDINPWIAEISSNNSAENSRESFATALEAASTSDDLEPLARVLDSAAFGAARRQAQLSRRRSGLDRWNHWAQRMLGVRAAAAADDAAFWLVWRAAALTRHDAEAGAPPRFGIGVLFSGVVTPGDLLISGLAFDEYADFDNCRIHGVLRIEDTTFRDGCSVSQAQLLDGSSICRSRFAARADFGGTRWRGPAQFEDVVFAGTAMFREAAFAGAGSFTDVRFEDGAGFHLARFEDAIEFRNCVFGGSASFQQTIFSTPPVYDDVTFEAALHTDHGISRRVRFPKLERATPGSASTGRPRRDGAA